MRTFPDPASLRAAYASGLENVKGPYNQMGLVEGLISGKAPYSPDDLRRHGCADMSNENFRDSKLRVRRVVNRFGSMIASPKPVVTVSLPKADRNVRAMHERAASDIFSAALLDTAELFSRRKARIRDMVKFGAGMLVFSDKFTVIPEYVSRRSFIVGADAGTDPAEWDAVYFRSTKSLVRLYELQSDEEVAEKSGWNVSEIRAVILRWKAAQKGDSLTPEQAYSSDRWLAFEEMAKTGLYDGSFEAYRLPVVEAYVLNSDRKVDRYIAVDGVPTDSKDAFLLKKPDAADSMEGTFHPLYYAEDTGFFWTSEGYGNDIYATESAALRLQNSAVDLTDLAMRPVLKSANRGNLMRVDRVIHVNSEDSLSADLLGARVELPVMMTSLLGRKADAQADNQVPSSADERGSKQPVSAEEMKLRIGESSEQEAAVADYFYRQEERLLQEICQRAVALHSDAVAKIATPELKDLGDQLREQLGKFPKDIEFSITRGIGYGSDQDRQRRLRVGYENRGALDPLGRANMVSDFYRELFGARAARYITEIDPRTQVLKESHDMRQENLFFSLGKSPQPAVDDNHAMHAFGHAQFLGQIMQQVMQAEEQQAQIDMAPVSATFGAGLPHLAYHVDQLGAAASSEQLQQEYKELYSVLSQLANFGKKARQNAEQQAVAAQQQQQQAAQQQQQMYQQLMGTIEGQRQQIMKLQADHTVARDKMEATQAVKERESAAKIDRLNRESEAKSATRMIDLNGGD